MRYYEDLDGLKGIAILGVVYSVNGTFITNWEYLPSIRGKSFKSLG